MSDSFKALVVNQDGENFTREARSIHYDKKTSQSIYGKATAEETTELLEEGIEVTTIPWVDKSEN